MLTDSLPNPHLPCTEQESCTEGRKGGADDAETDGRVGETKVRKGKDDPRLCPPVCYIPSLGSRCRSAEALVPEIQNLPWVSLDFPKEKEVTRNRSLHSANCSMRRKRRGLAVANEWEHGR